MSNLIEHARRELKIIGEEAATVEGYINVVRAFSQMGHSGGSASVAIPVINRLLQFQNLTALTANPSEWLHHGPEVWGEKDEDGIWQSIRNSEAFSHDGGKTYYLLSEGGSANNRAPLHTSEISEVDD